MLDTRRSIETPEGVEIRLRIAGPIIRGFAAFIDIFIIFVAAIAYSIIFPLLLGNVGVAVTFILVFMTNWFYPVVFEVYFKGATPGKKALGLKVLHDDGTEIGLQSSLIRNILRYVDFLPVGYGFGFVCMAFNADFKRLGDLTAGTLVVYSEKDVMYAEIPKQPPLLPRLALKTEEQRAIMQFAERLENLTVQRQNELSDILQTITHKTGAEATQELLQYANWMVGRR